MRYVFPRPVCLPANNTISHSELRLALGGASRALLYKWRKYHEFPEFFKDGRSTFSITEEVVDWLNKKGIEVKRVRK